MAQSGHFWAHLLTSKDVIKADDNIISILPLSNAAKVASQHGCIYFYVNCNASITTVDNVEHIGSHSALPLHQNTSQEDVVLCNERPNHSMGEAIPLPMLTFLKQTSAYQECHARLTAAAAQSRTRTRSKERRWV